MNVEVALKFPGAERGMPRQAQRRVISFYCPIRASSANEIATG